MNGLVSGTVEFAEKENQNGSLTCCAALHPQAHGAKSVAWLDAHVDNNVAYSCQPLIVATTAISSMGSVLSIQYQMVRCNVGANALIPARRVLAPVVPGFVAFVQRMTGRRPYQKQVRVIRRLLNRHD
jgi:hypothetical protein